MKFSVEFGSIKNTYIQKLLSHLQHLQCEKFKVMKKSRNQHASTYHTTEFNQFNPIYFMLELQILE